MRGKPIREPGVRPDDDMDFGRTCDGSLRLGRDCVDYQLVGEQVYEGRS